MGHVIVYHIGCILGRAPYTKGTQQRVIRLPDIHNFSAIDGWSTEPWVLGRQNLVSLLRYMNTQDLIGMGLRHAVMV